MSEFLQLPGEIAYLAVEAAASGPLTYATAALL